MKAKVDPNTCTGCGLCADVCPQIFVMDGDIAVANTGIVPSESEEICRDAAEGCPVEAISIEE